MREGRITTLLRWDAATPRDRAGIEHQVVPIQGSQVPTRQGLRMAQAKPLYLRALPGGQEDLEAVGRRCPLHGAKVGLLLVG